MALIVDQNLLNQGDEVTIDKAARTIKLNLTDNLSNDGVTLLALYKFLKEEWKNDDSLNPYPFPMESITPEQFEFIQGWAPADDPSRYLFRTAGWREITDTSAVKREYMGIVSLGHLGASNRAYFAFANDTAKTDFNFDGPVNQGIQTFGDSDNGGFDKRDQVLTVFIRSQGNTYASATSTSIGLGRLNYIANRFPLAQAFDSNIAASDSDIASDGPYTGMSIKYEATTRSIGGFDYNFDVIVNGNNGTTQQIYEFVQYSLRQAGDIDAGDGTQVGQLADALMVFEGDTLKTTTGVVIDNFQASDRNNLVFKDTDGVERTFPFLATGTLLFNSNLVSDEDAFYRMFFTDKYATDNALLVEDNSKTAISGLVNGRAAITFDFDYDGNTQGSRDAGSDAEVTVIASGLGKAKYVSTTSTITRSTDQNISLVAPLERSYSSSD